jgi:hypothetical protein
VATSPPAFDDQLLQAHLAQASAALPGPDYYTVLGWIHQVLRPSSYVEIGIRNGDSLLLASPAITCIGIDPAPNVHAPLSPQTQVFPITSDDFFATHDLGELLKSPAFTLAFIDGLHLFEQALLDFIHLERHAAPSSVIMIHDCLPLDQVTSDRVRSTHFYSGDIWKLAMCLKSRRPDLRMQTIATGPSGLCLVSHLDRQSRVLETQYQDCLAEYVPLNFEAYRRHPERMPQTVSNDFEAVRQCLAGLTRP